MFYTYEITVPANTAKRSPREDVVKLTAGVITRVSYRPRPGHAALCHCQVLYHEHQITPTNPDGELHGDTFPIESDEFLELDSIPYDLKIVSWNDDDTYDHTFDISFTVLPRAAVFVLALVDFINNLAGIFSPRRIFGGGG
ncbi:MAG: hypothetical protein M0R06_06485 [Sphaerochaeta sp.]|jgi:hypothetical protein|nr:hypothetical protein [Sphaerochaeta sp.]MDD4985140.1 hypothetical protein [Dehalococcoidales bacterium]